MKKTILITNDDGFKAKGLHILIDALKDIADITIVAPAMEKSACGHSLTLTRPLRFIELEKNFYKLDDGTPSDCIFLSLSKIFKDKKPDLVVSGINMGANLGEDITYSGTASAAMEAVLQDIPAIAFSQVYKSNPQEINFNLAKDIVKKLVTKVLKDGHPLQDRKFLNVNIPPITLNEYKGIKITHAGKKEYGFDAQMHYSPRGIEYYWIGLPKIEWKKSHNTKHNFSDMEAIEQDFVSITPIHLDMTHYESIKQLEEWL